MRRLLATLALGLLTACAATAATSDTVTRACDDYAYGCPVRGAPEGQARSEGDQARERGKRHLGAVLRLRDRPALTMPPR